ncbi:MAG: TetR/AcrR family transcriptional regulator [Actinomycetota bacterium]|nr:TetR/AcrR family transcriptional regulator [Actinomycetota bacterium]
MGAHGIAGLTNRRVATAAGISLGSLTYHFTSQTDLLRESLLLFVADETHRISAIADRLADSVHGVQDAAAAAERALADVAFGPEEIGVYELYVHSARDPELHTAARQCFAAYEQVARTTLGLLGLPDPERVAPHVVALVAGAQLRRLATGSKDAAGIGDGLLMLLNGAPLG